jgi:hypothetical protein
MVIIVNNGDCPCNESEYDRSENKSFCIICGLETETNASWCLTVTDKITLKRSAIYDDESETYKLSLSPNTLGYQRYLENINIIFNKLNIT